MPQRMGTRVLGREGCNTPFVEFFFHAQDETGQGIERRGGIGEYGVRDVRRRRRSSLNFLLKRPFLGDGGLPADGSAVHNLLSDLHILAKITILYRAIDWSNDAGELW